MEEEFRTLDIKYAQVVITDHNDEEFRYKHRVLLCRVDGGIWVAADPDYVLQPLNLAQTEHIVLRRNALFPPECLAEDAGLWTFGPVSAADLRRLEREARLQASLLGGASQVDAETQGWYFSDVFEGKFAEVVPQDVIEDPHRFTSLGGHGVAILDGGAFRCEVVSTGDFDKWKLDCSKAAKDQRLQYGLADGATLLMSVNSLKESAVTGDMPGWTFLGPRACQEWVQAVAEGPGNFVSYHGEWIRRSGVSEGSSVAHEHRHHCECIRLALATDGLHIFNLASFEHIVRRVVQLELAVAKNPRAPDFTGLHVITASGVDSRGAAQAQAFGTFITERQKEEAFVLKQTRLYAEEANKQRAVDSDIGNERRLPRGGRKGDRGKGKGKDGDG